MNYLMSTKFINMEKTPIFQGRSLLFSYAAFMTHELSIFIKSIQSSLFEFFVVCILLDLVCSVVIMLLLDGLPMLGFVCTR